MARKADTQEFGRKRGFDGTLSFAETLLSGKALPPKIHKYTTALKPRPKACFGTKGLRPRLQSYEAIEVSSRKGWKFWL
ncbi:MAG: hypothetical protein JKY92_09885 [Magnetovibrio sp.]|nr:hypothetical protein [Magnetovibrio sp.]